MIVKFIGVNILPEMTKKTYSYLFLFGFNYRSHGYSILIFSFIIKNGQQYETSVFLSVYTVGLTGFLLLSQTVTQLMFMICGFRIYEFAYSLKLICNPKINTRAFRVILRHVQNSENLSPRHAQETEQGDTLPSCSSSPCVNKCPLQRLFSATFSHFCAFLGGILLFKMLPSIVLKCGPVFLSTRRLWCALRRKHASLRPELQWCSSQGQC